MNRVLPILIACTVGAAAAIAQPATGPLLIEHVRVFDGTRILDNRSVLVESGVIRSVAATIPRPPDATIVDGAGKTLLPGLIDAHTHTIVEASLQQAPVFGVTTDLDMFTDPAVAASIKKRQKEGDLLDYADLRSAGYLATVPGGHGTEYGIKVPTLTRPEEAQSWVDARIAEGSDYIKTVYDDMLEYGIGKPSPTLTKEVMKALTDAAHKRGKLVVVHIGSLQQALDAIDAGADGLAHLFAGPASAPDFGKTRRIAWHFCRPHADRPEHHLRHQLRFGSGNDPRLKPYLPPSETTAMQAHFGLPVKVSCEGASVAVRQLKAARVPILAGTDAGNPGTTQGASIHGELELLVRAGLTPAEALHAATAASSAAFRLDDRGQIAPGQESRPGARQWRPHHRYPPDARHRSRLESRARDRPGGVEGVGRQTDRRPGWREECSAAARVGIRLDRRFRAGRRTAGEVWRGLDGFDGSSGGRQINRENGGYSRRGGRQQERPAGDRRGRDRVCVPVVRCDVLARPQSDGAGEPLRAEGNPILGQG